MTRSSSMSSLLLGLVNKYSAMVEPTNRPTVLVISSSMFLCFDLFRAAGSQEFNLNHYGIKSLNHFDPKTIKDEINNELLELSEAHHERYFKKI